MQIFVHRDDQDFGPYTVEEAQYYLGTGDLLPEDHAWYEGAADWMPLEEIPGVIPPEAKPARSNTGLPKWVPPRRTDAMEEGLPTPAPFTPIRPAAKSLTPVTPPTTETAAPPTVSSAPPDELPEDVVPRNPRSAGIWNMVIGVILFIGGAAFAYHTFKTADKGGGYNIIAWGAMGVGLIQVLRGLVLFLKG